MNADNALLFLDIMNHIDPALLDEAENAAGMDRLITGEAKPKRERRPWSPAAIAACVAVCAVVVYLAVLLIGRNGDRIAAWFGRFNDKRTEETAEDGSTVIEVQDLRNYFFDFYNKQSELLPGENSDPARVPQSDRNALIGQTYRFPLTSGSDDDPLYFCLYMTDTSSYRLAVVVGSDHLPLLLVFHPVSGTEQYLMSGITESIENGGAITAVLVSAMNIDPGQQTSLSDALGQLRESGTARITAADFESGNVPARLGYVVGSVARKDAEMYFTEDDAAVDRFKEILSVYDMVHVVRNGEPTPEEVERGNGRKVFIDYASQEPGSWEKTVSFFREKGEQYLAFCGHKKSSVSYWSEGGLCAYTVTEMVIDTVIDREGRIFDTAAERMTVTILEQHAFAPNGRIAYGILEGRQDGKSYSLLNLPGTCEPVDNTSQYVVVLCDWIQLKVTGGVIRNAHSDTVIFGESEFDSLFMPYMIRRYDPAFMAEAVKDDTISDPEKRQAKDYQQNYTFLYYDLMELLAEKTGTKWGKK